MHHPQRCRMAPMNPLISVAELQDLVRADAVTVLDVRWQLGGPSGVEQFAAGHVPGAAFVALDTALAAPAGPGGRHPLPSSAVFTAAMQAAGVHADRPVVVMDDWQGRAAARAWWLLRDHGHQDVRVLDGGWSAWRAAGGELATGYSEVSPGDFTGEAGHLSRVDATDVPGVAVLVDARNPERYRGESEPVDPVAGHIPGAVNVPTGDNLRSDGTFRSSDDLALRYQLVGAVPGADVAVYCGSGVTACHDLLALEVAGVRAALYPGSWSGWVTDPTRPVAIGS